MKVILEERLVDELADAAHEFRLHVQERGYGDNVRARDACRSAERRLRLAINAVRGLGDDTAWAS